MVSKSNQYISKHNQLLNILARFNFSFYIQLSNINTLVFQTIGRPKTMQEMCLIKNKRLNSFLSFNLVFFMYFMYLSPIGISHVLRPKIR
jgi:hypothetical protein